jgi:dienelactone hydrolase
MKYWMLILLMLLLVRSKGQSKLYLNDSMSSCVSKPMLDQRMYQNWPKLGLLKISDNGKYCGYIVSRKSVAASILILVSTETKWEIESTIVGWYNFSSDGRKAVWINAHDSLCIATLGTYNIYYIPNVLSFNLDGGYLTYQSKNIDSGFVKYEFNGNELKDDTSIREQIIISKKKLLVVLCTDKDNNQKIVVRNKYRDKAMIVWKGVSVHDIVKDNDERQMAFMSGAISNTLYYYKLGMDKVIYLELPAGSNAVLSGISHFSKNCKYIFLSLDEVDTSVSRSNYFLNVWSYLDNILQSQQLKGSESTKYTGVIRLSDHHFNRLDSGNDWLFFPAFRDSLALIRQQMVVTAVEERNWNLYSDFFWYLISMADERKVRLSDIKKSRVVQLSPSGKYVIYYDDKMENYFVYETGSGKNRCITMNIEDKWNKDTNSNTYGKYIAGWGNDDEMVLINGERDIWQIDPSGSKPPINLTNGYGRKHDIIFSLALDEYSHRGILRSEPLILTAFNFKTKDNGFYRKVVSKKGDPDSLTMGPYIYDIKDNPSIPEGANYSPIKALNTEKYVVRRMRFNEAPNFFFTTNFKSFRPISNIQPHSVCNWYSAELHAWKSLDNNMLQGVLYKPENFDSSKRYPIIFYCYEKKSDGLNAYLEPGALDNGCAINIPYYVSNGYLVFSPDILYQVGDPMQGAYNAIVSAVNYLKKLPYVDSKRLGIQGCSWGAIQVNYLVANSNLFSAACSVSGIANWISEYGGLTGSGESMQNMFENGQFRMGSTLWDLPKAYIKNSPVFRVDSITTPILLMHTTNDWLCDISGIQKFFYSLCRLRKKSWLLQYNGNHGVFGNDADDFGIRMKQFFDHYLRDYPAPKWMTSINYQE